DAVLGRQAAARPNLGLITLGDRHGESARDQLDIARLKGGRFLDRRADIETGRILGHSFGQGQTFTPGQTLDFDCYRAGQGANSSHRPTNYANNATDRWIRISANSGLGREGRLSAFPSG